MFGFLFNCIKNFGLSPGLRVYLQIKVFKTGKFILPGLAQSIYFRPYTSDVHTFREIFLREEYSLAASIVSNPKTIIDAGANIGFTTLFFTQRYPNARIISLEPDQANFVYLKKNTIGYAHITPLQAALWNKKGTIEIKDKGYGVRGFMAEDSASSASINTMPSTTMRDLLQEYTITRIDILKMDIEGSEREVFSIDAEYWLPITKCIIIELHDRMKDGCSTAVFKALSQFNFECMIKGENLVFINKDLN